MRRLAPGTLERLPGTVRQPSYDRSAVRNGVLHIGVGAFHRAHQAVILDDVSEAGDPRWGIVGVSMRSADVHNRLAPQQGLYTLLVEDGARKAARVIGALHEVLVASREPERLLDAFINPDLHLVTLTITEKGYWPPTHDPIDTPSAAPLSAVPLLAAGLQRRRSAGFGGLTLMSCDNLPANGRRLRDAVLAEAEVHWRGLGEWIMRNATFPATMVDRIVPATTEEDIQKWSQETGLEDRALVRTEPFLQWVIQDSFAGPMPDLTSHGATLTDDVERWEQAKLRLLNGAHSAMAYLGGLAGMRTVAEFAGWDAGETFLGQLWRETGSTLAPDRAIDPVHYSASLLKRFKNPSLNHQLLQIAVDGSQKLPQRLVAPLVERLRSGAPAEALGLAVAAWMRWQSGVDDQGRPLPVEDPLWLMLRRHADDPAGLISIAEIFPPEAQNQPGLLALVDRQWQRLNSHGARAAVDALVTTV